MAMTVAISPGILILLLCLQNILAQQCFNNAGLTNSAGAVQQSQQKVKFGLNQIPQNTGLNFNSPQQANMQQMNFQQQSNIQQAPFTQQTNNLQPQLNLQEANSQQSVNSITNSQPQQQQNENLATSIFSALHNIRQSSQSQGKNIAKANPSQHMNYYEQTSQLQNQPSFTISAPLMNKPQTVNQPSSAPTSFVESQQFQPTFTFHPLPSNNSPFQQNQLVFTPSSLNTYTNGQGYSIQSQPTATSVTSQQATNIQSPMVMVPGVQTTTAQSQPIVLTLQTPQMQSEQNHLTQATSQTSQSQPIIYTVQTQPSSAPNQNQRMVSNQPQGTNNAPMDNHSLMSLVMSQMQNSQGKNNVLDSILPAMYTKSEKSSSMKALLPLILNMLNERRSGCGCPHCGCSNSHNQNTQEPVINSGYSNQKDYSQQEPTEEVLSKISENIDTSVKSNSVAKKNKVNKKNEIINNSAAISEEVEEEDESEEDYDDE